MTLTSSFAMFPPQASQGHLKHPDARYFNVGTITEEQLNDYVGAVVRKPLR